MNQLKRFLLTIYKAGWSNMLLYIVLLIAAVLLALDTIHPDFISKERLLNILGIIILSVMAELLYFHLTEKQREGGFMQSRSSGIRGVFDCIDCAEYRSLMSRPGKKTICNIWMHNFEELSRLLRKALEDERTEINLIILSFDSEFVAIRGAELQRDTSQAIRNNKDEIAHFIRSLPPQQRGQVKVLQFKGTPKFTIHASGGKGFLEEAFVGLYWPGKHAVDGTQFWIKGKKGYFARDVWDYYESLNKTDITKEICRLSEHP